MYNLGSSWYNCLNVERSIMAYKANLERLMVSKMQDTLFDRWSTVTLKEVMELAASKIELYGEDATVELTTEEHDDTVRAYIFKMIPETDDEMEKRITDELKWEKESKDREDKKDAEEYARLKAKFENK